MSSHTFKVGDRVRHLKGETYVVRAVVEHGMTGKPVVAVSDDENRQFWWLGADVLSPLPLFEPVERWMILSDGELEWTTFGSPGRDGLWVKVIISPAEDQS